MKRIIVPGVLLLMGVTGEAMAVCANEANICYTQATDLPGLLQGNTVCDGSLGNWKGQEWHSGSSGQDKNLIDYKFGRTPPYTNSLSNPNDKPYGPSEPVGTWSISGDTVTYGYYKDTNNPAAGTVNNSNKVWQKSDGTYDFCDSNTLQLVANVTIQTGQGACTGSHVPIACSASAASSTLIGSPAANVTSTKENEIQDKQEKPIESPAKDDDKQGKQAKPIAFPGPILPPTKEGNKQGEKDKSIVPPVKEGGKQGKQVKPIVSPAKEGDKQGKQGN